MLHKVILQAHPPDTTEDQAHLLPLSRLVDHKYMLRKLLTSYNNLKKMCPSYMPV